MHDPDYNTVQELTALLRSDDDPFWARLRELLRDKGVAPERAVLAECFPDDDSLEFGVVVAENERVFQFDFNYLRRQVSAGFFSDWEDLTDRWRETPYQSSIEAGLKFLKGKIAG